MIGEKAQFFVFSTLNHYSTPNQANHKANQSNANRGTVGTNRSEQYPH